MLRTLERVSRGILGSLSKASREFRRISGLYKMVTNGHEELSTKPPVFPWFGLDIGGSLVKFVYFEPLDLTSTECELEGPTLMMIRRYLISNRAYGHSGVRDTNLELRDARLRDRRGNIHFIRFPTILMPNFIQMCIEKNLHTLTLDVYVTGGGAYKFEKQITENMKVNWHKCDELDTLIRGIHYLASKCPNECYYYEPDGESEDMTQNLQKRRFCFNNPYPYLLVNVGTGVSILLVEGQDKFRRITGSSIGGGTFLGLCRLLTGCMTFDDAMSLASRGNSEHVDKLVRDIYGGDYARFGLPGHVVASSFGNVGQIDCSEKSDNPSHEDLARATLVTILNNLTSIVCLCASTMGMSRILFVGSFLRNNELSLKQIAMGMHFWTRGTIQPIFLEHEGYMGAFGCLRKYVLDNGNGSHHCENDSFPFKRH